LIDELAWLAGSWKGNAFGGVIEETFTKPNGGCILGTSRVLSQGKTVHREFLELIETDKKIFYIVHLPKKVGKFALVASGVNWARWRDPENDFPSLIEYRRKGETITVLLQGLGENGKRVQFTMTRQKP